MMVFLWLSVAGLVDVRNRPEANNTYVAQENLIDLSCTASPPIHHPAVLEFFDSYDPAGFYVPCEDLRRAYPHDYAVSTPPHATLPTQTHPNEVVR